MANKKPAKMQKATPNKLPWVQTAAFCEQILEDKDGVLSAIRIFDRLNIEIPASPPAGAPEGAVPSVAIKVLVTLKSDSVKGRRTIKIVYKCPNGTTGQAAEAAGVFEGGEHGVNIQAFVGIPMTGYGLYWCDVLVNDSLVTRIPLRVAPPIQPSERGDAMRAAP